MNFTKKQVLERVKGLDDEQRNSVVCALVGHSRIQSQFFGYWNCGRCGATVGDSLAGVYSAKGVVVVGHNCATCYDLYKKLNWKDKLFAPDPFATESAVEA